MATLMLLPISRSKKEREAVRSKEERGTGISVTG